MPGTELLAALLGSVALLLWGVRMGRTGLTRAFGAAHRRAAKLDRHRAVAGFVELPRRAGTASRARSDARRRRRLRDRGAGVLSRRQVAVVAAGRGGGGPLSGGRGGS